MNLQSSKPSPPHSCVSASNATSSQYQTHILSRNGHTESPKRYLKLFGNFAIAPSMLLVPRGYLFPEGGYLVLESQEVLHLVIVVDALQQSKSEVLRRGHGGIQNFKNLLLVVI